MDIKEAQYVKEFRSDEIGSIRIVVGDIISQVPLAPDNIDYVEIMRQVKAGTLTIKDAD
tara:strand:- start:3 stop:179 length:177 start_codon:yes stop_codon:yes gene_type:complete